MRRLLPFLLAAVAVLALVAGCAGSPPAIAMFTREWEDGRMETLELYDDGRVLMNHVGTIDRATLDASDVARLRTALADVRPAADPSAFPRLTLTPSDGDPVVVDTGPGTTGELFLTLLDTHRLP